MEKVLGKKALTLEIFIERSIQKYGNVYNFSKAQYGGIRTTLIITCPTHGDFDRTPEAFLRGNYCTTCRDNVRRDLKIKQVNRSNKAKCNLNRHDAIVSWSHRVDY